ncbi:MAG: ABC transporter ATP-binding protein [Candidatus Avoscillospira sp.]
MDQNVILEVKNLSLNYVTDDGTVYAVNDLNFVLHKGTTLCLVGETGAGKTSTAKAIMGILPHPQSKILSGEVLLEGEDLLKASKKRMQNVRGSKISMIFQDPMTSLNPVMRVSDQVAEVLRLHKAKSRIEAAKMAKEVLLRVGIKEDRITEYPHQFSGGMRQRVGIAMALACSPEILIADEPTTALDVTIQAQVLELMKELKKQYEMAMIMITHDLGIVADVCDYVAVMYAGSIVEYGDRRHIFTNAKHPYTIGLFGCIPDLSIEQEELIPIKGMTPDPSKKPKGCAFAPRCAYATEQCFQETPGNYEIEPGHWVRCLQFRGEDTENV